ncbi:MAG: sensor histidine kinase [Minwuia sp.]|uniref:sensor histidine kinase n=1 Tax=Minwuia sp. TaxID=2493630 RepID=UPI003A86D7D2
MRQAARNLLEMKHRLTRQIEQRGEMLAGVSHDLRSPLTRMKLQLAMLGESPEVEALRGDVSDMQRMVDAYLAFARGQETEPAEPMDFGQLMEEVGADMARQGAPVTVEAVGDLSMIGRPNGLKRCLTNLTENSRRFAQRISLRAERRVGQILVQIDDDGPGIPADKRKDVFRPFARLDDARGPDSGGAGLGLTIARDVIRQHGGDIRLLDAPIGGLRVEMRIPV